MTSGPTIHVFEPHQFWGRGHSETCYNICAPWAESGQKVIVNTILSHRDDPAGIIHPLLPSWLPPSATTGIEKAAGRDRLLHRTEDRGLARVRPGDICFFWPGSNVDAMHCARRAGAVITLEFINTHVNHRYRIIREAARERGLHVAEVLQAKSDKEAARLRAADIVFAPGPFVSKSVRDHAKKPPLLLETSYGANVSAITVGRSETAQPLRFLFVGKLSLGKGALDLLDAWRLADCNAVLALAGHVDPQVRPFLEDAPRGATHLGFQEDVGVLYRTADVFVFPSLDEGGPQVCYEAAAHGLPMIVTPMGGGRIADDSNALIVPPCDPKALAEAIRRMAADPELRARLGEGSRKAAPYYDWKEVSKRRLAQLLEAASVVQANRN